MLGGGLGAQPRHADLLYEFLPTNRIIPLMEGVVRVFDRYGERKSRARARMKFLLRDLGLQGFKALLSEEEKAVEHKSYEINIDSYPSVKVSDYSIPTVEIDDLTAFEHWKSTNLVSQKQKGFVAIGIKVSLGDFYTDKARQLANLVEQFAASEIRLSLRQNILIPYVREEAIPYFYQELKKLGFAEAGYNKAIDITACPGTDTCNLGIASSTGIATELERVIKDEYPQYIDNPDVVIKISGCMNACGQHTMAHIGFQGMSIRTKDKLVAPALQVLLGGGNLGNGRGIFADKVIKIPSKRGPAALRIVLDDFQQSGQREFEQYYSEKGEKYFYELLKPLANIENLDPEDFYDWGTTERYKKAIGVGECAGVVIDLIATLLFESEEKIGLARERLSEGKWAASIYYSYAAMVNGAKALLTLENTKTNTHASIIKDFHRLFVASQKFPLDSSFEDLVLQLNKNEASASFARQYLSQAEDFIKRAEAYRARELKVA
jgi:sulfite reductase (ferredoxin)